MNFFEKLSTITNSGKAMIETFIALSLFIFVSFGVITLLKLIAGLLAFIVILEVVRMIIDFVLDGKKIMKITLIIDGFIVFFLRDVVLIFSEEKYPLPEKQEKIIMLFLMILSFFLFRYLSVKYSPNESLQKNNEIESNNVIESHSKDDVIEVERKKESDM